MVDAEHPNEYKEQTTSDGSHPAIDAALQGTRGALDAALARKAQQLAELSARRETKELSPYDFDLNFIYQLNVAGSPLTRKDMQHETGNQALVLTRDDLRILGSLSFISASGKRVVIRPENIDPNDVFILYPDEVGDEKHD